MATYITSDNFNSIVLIISVYFAVSQLIVSIEHSILLKEINKLRDRLNCKENEEAKKDKVVRNSTTSKTNKSV